MATFSYNKNPKILASNFARDFKSFESYMKHCLNGLKRIDWFKVHQFDSSVSDFEYMEKFLQTQGFNIFEYLAIFSIFQDEVLTKIVKTIL